ncbi:HAD family hydrolase [Methylocystis heyeri]|uniref:HAD-IA family hydrolase n=1 Tax=Methylocystis heyeri TaxID=391905 RepID=A0A6B8KJX3_9HYPH|nr:HAD family phosphatase [Methylocystis heyeri]QGM47849.1 HAD-IA family hydrolase [Methylocystis heyeri]
MSGKNTTKIIFDLGNVLLDWSPRYLYSKIFHDEAQLDWFLANVCADDWIRELDRGMPFAEGVAERSRLFPQFAGQIEAFDTRWQETLKGAIEGSVRLLEELHDAGAPIYALTNFSAEKYRETRPRYGFFSRFTGLVVSGEEGLIKPDPAIYRLLLQRFGLRAEECLFIDDRPANVVAAQELGIASVRFEDPLQLEAALRSYGFLQSSRASSIS